MEREVFFSGYCRVLDGSRTVCAVEENGELTDVDCSFFDCPYAPQCTVAAQIRGLSEEK